MRYIVLIGNDTDMRVFDTLTCLSTKWHNSGKKIPIFDTKLILSEEESIQDCAIDSGDFVYGRGKYAIVEVETLDAVVSIRDDFPEYFI